MPELITTGSGGVLAVSAGVTVATLLTGMDAGTAIGSFAGAVVFVLSAADFPVWKRLALFVASFIAGVIAAGVTAKIISALLPGSVEVEKPVGAIIAAAAAVRVLMLFSVRPRSDGSVFDRFGGGDK